MSQVCIKGGEGFFVYCDMMEVDRNKLQMIVVPRLV